MKLETQETISKWARIIAKLAVIACILIGFITALDLIYKLGKDSVLLKTPAKITAPKPMLGQNTLTPAVLKLFIQNSNSKVYNRLADEIVSASIKYGNKYTLSPVLIISVMYAESEFNLNAVSPVGAQGLMQVMWKTWGERLIKEGIVESPVELHDPIKNIEAGSFILREYINETKDFSLALNKYLGANSVPYKEKIGKTVGSILMIGISKEINASYKLR
jgi:soluble lytic murein transglycosylase-like protein